MSSTSGLWKSVEIIASDTLTVKQSLALIHSQLRVIATEGGEFVRRIRIDRSEPLSGGCVKWIAHYLPGPPAAFPDVESLEVGPPQSTSGTTAPGSKRLLTTAPRSPVRRGGS
jgi:hypothetical protein